ncbi:ROK family protein [Enterococcus sp. FDAARGOS_553]|uniref:ROK family protein n=1 Tax=Enterococcus sp. FDAARGOS_553 TaxID=2420313 RepID=UPI000F4FC775|nr:ROK family protein [Enterococcus sp. FDAARGOS_553]AYY10489.1 ROK family protein [Enterococcus sp. FDAARGOS_553]
MYLGIDIGGTTIKYGFIDDKGQVYCKQSIKTIDNRHQFLVNLQTIIEESQRQEPIEGIGISAPGIIDQHGTMITAGAIKSIYGVRLKQELQKITKVPIVIENDANAAAIAEQWIGHAQGIPNYICMVLGTGIGGGIIYQNELIKGAHGMAGEFGWMVIKEINESVDIEAMSLNQRAAVMKDNDSDRFKKEYRLSEFIFFGHDKYQSMASESTQTPALIQPREWGEGKLYPHFILENIDPSSGTQEARNLSAINTNWYTTLVCLIRSSSEEEFDQVISSYSTFLDQNGWSDIEAIRNEKIAENKEKLGIE